MGVEMKVFEHPQFGSIRTIVEDGKTLFCGLDAAKALGYAKPQDAINRHCRYSVKRGVGVQTGTRADGSPAIQTVDMLFISVLEKGAPKVGGSDGALKIEPSDFFIPSTYVSEQNKVLPCYLITRKGCDMVGHKLNGEKGVLFTAAYVSAFEEMQEMLTKPRLPPEVSPGGLAKLIAVNRQIILAAGGTPQDVCEMASSVFQLWCLPVPKSLSKQVPGQISWFAELDTPPAAQQPQPGA